MWCEHKLLPVTALNPEGDKRGVYEIELSKEWVKKAAPTIKVISTTLKYALPIVIPGTKLTTDDTQFAAIEDELKFGEKTSNSLLDAGGSITDNFDHERANLRDEEKGMLATGSILYDLHAILKKQDPKFGGLVRVENKRGEFLWVHEDFVKEYY